MERDTSENKEELCRINVSMEIVVSSDWLLPRGAVKEAENVGVGSRQQ